MAKHELPGVWLLDAFRRGGVETQQLAARLPDLVERLLRDPADLPPDEVNRIFLACEALSGDASFGLHMVDWADMSMFGTYGYLLRHAPTIERLLQLAERYYRTFYRGGRISLSVDSERARIEYRVDDPPSVSGRHDHEWTLGFFVTLIRERVGPEWYPQQVTFANEAPRDLNELHRVLGKNLSFGQPQNTIEFDRRLLDRGIDDVDRRLLDILTDQAEALLDGVVTRGSLRSEVRLHILEGLESGAANADRVARHMAMSVSTLKRRLATKGLTFRSLRDDVVREVATKALLEDDLSVGNIALMLGYADSSAFHRAFVRLTGQTPTELRQSSRRDRVGPGRLPAGKLTATPQDRG